MPNFATGAAFADAVSALAPEPPAEKREAIMAKAAELRDRRARVSDLEEQIKAENKLINEIKHKTLPDLMTEAGMDRMGVPAVGNMSAYDLVLKPYYHAVISAEWDVVRQEAA